MTQYIIWPATSRSHASSDALAARETLEAEAISRRLSCLDFRVTASLSHSGLEKVLAVLLHHDGVSRAVHSSPPCPCCSWLTMCDSGKVLAEPSVSIRASNHLVVLISIGVARDSSNRHAVRRRRQRSARKAGGGVVSQLAAPASRSRARDSSCGREPLGAVGGAFWERARGPWVRGARTT